MAKNKKSRENKKAGALKEVFIPVDLIGEIQDVFASLGASMEAVDDDCDDTIAVYKLDRVLKVEKISSPKLKVTEIK
jgi:hypothetical protein